ncbi:hypothetical protein LCGC14_0952930 [marine sediment metagenome]|uniref:Uncharacterized protein n=1 Tax=marine sediment metagenome TaxID=412755 RepID=A0A0F9P2U1_9ZZZZ
MSKKNRRQSQQSNVIGKPTPKQLLYRARFNLKGIAVKTLHLFEWIVAERQKEYLTKAESAIVTEMCNALSDWVDEFDIQTDELREELEKRLKDAS